jgi:hypothetical protein
MKASHILSREEMLQARLKQPRLSLEELRLQEEHLRQMSEEFAKDASKETSKSGRSRVVAG